MMVRSSRFVLAESGDSPFNYTVTVVRDGDHRPATLTKGPGSSTPVTGDGMRDGPGRAPVRVLGGRSSTTSVSTGGGSVVATITVRDAVRRAWSQRPFLPASPTCPAACRPARWSDRTRMTSQKIQVRPGGERRQPVHLHGDGRHRRGPSPATLTKGPGSSTP